MDWKTLFLSAEGRMGQKDFWIGFGILFVIGLVLKNIPSISWIWTLASIYFNVCIFGKRLHDIGKSAWLILIPVGIMSIAVVVAAFLGGAAFLGADALGNDGLAALGAVASLGLAGLVLLIGAAGCLGFVIWLGTRAGDAVDNQFGPVRAVPLVTMM